MLYIYILVYCSIRVSEYSSTVCLEKQIMLCIRTSHYRTHEINFAVLDFIYLKGTNSLVQTNTTGQPIQIGAPEAAQHREEERYISDPFRINRENEQISQQRIFTSVGTSKYLPADSSVSKPVAIKEENCCCAPNWFNNSMATSSASSLDFG